MNKAAILGLALIGSVATAQTVPPQLPPATVGAYDVSATAPGEVTYCFGNSQGSGKIVAKPQADGSTLIEVELISSRNVPAPPPRRGYRGASKVNVKNTTHTLTRRVDDFDPSNPRFSARFKEMTTVKVELSMVDALLGGARTKQVEVETTLELLKTPGPVVETQVRINGVPTPADVTHGDREASPPGRARMRRDSRGLRLKVQSEDGSWSVDLRAANTEGRTLEFRGTPVGSTTSGPVEVTASLLNFRNEPRVAEETFVVALESGTKGTVVDSRGGWRHVQLEDGQTLWASAKHLRPLPQDGAAEVRLTLNATANGWAGTLVGSGPELELNLERRKRVLLVVDDKTLGGYATRTWWYYRDTHGFKKFKKLNTHALNSSDEEQALLDTLNRAGAEQLPYDRVVFYSHGGWDGPFIGDQFDPPGSSSYKKDEWAGLVRAVKAGTTPDAKIYSSSCHGAGDNRHEYRRSPDDRWWTASLGRATERWVSGPAGKTSTEYAVQQVQSSLELEGVVKQETLVTIGSTNIRIMPGRSFDAGRRVNVPAKAWE